MKIATLLLIPALIATSFADDNDFLRTKITPEGHLQYRNSDGNTANPKSHSSKLVRRSPLRVPVRTQRQDTKQAQTDHELQPQETQQQTIQTIQYKPYSMLPSDIKQLMGQMYQPQLPWVDPRVYIYRTSMDSDDSEKESSNNNENVQSENSQGSIKYRDENRKSSSFGHDSGMPLEIQQLLFLQAQTPYHVIANNIQSEKTEFVPEPFKPDEKNPQQYPTKVYYLKDVEQSEKDE